MFAVDALSQLVNPTKVHSNMVKHIFRYLKGSARKTLVYMKTDEVRICMYTDASYASTIDDRKSQSGFIGFHGKAAVTWTSKKQKSVAVSSTEAEYMALSLACRQVLKVSPAAEPPKKPTVAETSPICFCKTVMPVLCTARLFGMFPIIVHHQDGKCVFQKSFYWMIYTFGTACFFAYVAIFNIDYINLIKPKSLLPILEDVTNAFYTFYMIIATLLILMRAKKVAETLNQFTTVFKDGVFCSSARRIAVLTQYGILATLLGTMLLQGAIVYWLHLTRSHITNFSIYHFLLKMMQTMTFVIYAQFCTFIAMIIGALACFEKLTLSCLGYVPVHPMKVIAYLVYSFEHPAASTIHIVNCMVVFLHTWGLFIFLKNSQNMKNMIQGLTSFLLEYSTRISNQDEHQQVRYFIEKLKQHRPFTASGVFTIDLGIAGPISANILTYVLVALQFDLPEE
ncbi:hypothetical protein JTB14_000920 [Gonioctena quinquepunctata]|nr:hypothetical protein JTB14_000920 [Gonioctena quinquepunctata]